MCCMLVVSGGVCEVQKRTCVVPELHPGCGGAEDEPPPPPQAATTVMSERSTARNPRPGITAMAFLRHVHVPRAFFPVGRFSHDRGESAPAWGPLATPRTPPLMASAAK